MTEHRVASHLGVDAASYDAQIRRWIPGYEGMVSSMLSIIDHALGPAPLVIDLGTGTGALAGAILDAIPRARVLLVDIDPTMLAVAGARVANHGARAELRKASFFDDDALPPCDAVVASLALHHVADVDRKRELFARIHRALHPGGICVLGDATVHGTGAERAQIYREWEAGMAEHGIPSVEAHALFAQWAGEDFYNPLAVELSLLAAAGFSRPDCFWKRGAITVYGGFK